MFYVCVCFWLGLVRWFDFRTDSSIKSATAGRINDFCSPELGPAHFVLARLVQVGALALLDAMCDSSIRPDHITFTAVPSHGVALGSAQGALTNGQ